jgi:tetratricopeptide (TPR) repeat protein
VVGADALAHALRAMRSVRSLGPRAVATPAGSAGAGGEVPAPGSPADGGEARVSRLRRLHRGVRALLAVSILAVVVLGGILVGEYASGNLSGKGSSPTVSQHHLADQLVRGRALVAKGKDGDAFALFATVLKENPNQPEALAYEGWLLRLTGVSRHETGLTREGLGLVRKAVALDPSYPDAHLFLGVMLDQDEHDPSDAVAQLRLFLADKPTTALVRRAAPVIDQVFADDHQPAPALP